MLTINDDRSREKIANAVAKIKTSLPVLLDEDSKTVAAYRAYALPTIYLIDQQQKVFKVWTGPLRDREREVIDDINALLKSNAPDAQPNP